ncbi:mycothiol system anti-sigma-R factor [Gephyromycinifex aptenodytis]|uniref:mycothiol system anti-sigma-R factor n=1 Tax=Gephyromycinifex aptenodytis TaxID=2716227 RepID=UPI001444D1F0|nr:mycothiol system anti-sigma-R factor [Gephyromycinifex aptenodytis]
MSAAESPFDCSEFNLRVYEYIDSEMTAQDCERLRAHLDECGSCLDEYERDLVLKALVRRSCACQPAPTTLRMQILARITTVSVQITDN